MESVYWRPHYNHFVTEVCNVHIAAKRTSVILSSEQYLTFLIIINTSTNVNIFYIYFSVNIFAHFLLKLHSHDMLTCGRAQSLVVKTACQVMFVLLHPLLACHLECSAINNVKFTSFELWTILSDGKRLRVVLTAPYIETQHQR